MKNCAVQVVYMPELSERSQSAFLHSSPLALSCFAHFPPLPMNHLNKNLHLRFYVKVIGPNIAGPESGSKKQTLWLGLWSGSVTSWMAMTAHQWWDVINFTVHGVL